MTETDWMDGVRAEALSILMKSFGDTHPNGKIYECAEEWASKGHVTTSGIVKYFEAYFA